MEICDAKHKNIQMEKPVEDRDQNTDPVPQRRGFLVLDRRSLLMLGLGAGVIGLSGLPISCVDVSSSTPPELPAGFSYLTLDGNFLTFEGQYLILELS